MFIKVAHPFKLRTYFRPCYFILSIVRTYGSYVFFTLATHLLSSLINKSVFIRSCCVWCSLFGLIMLITVTSTGLTLFFQCNLVTDKPNRKLRPCGFSSLAFSLFHSRSVFFPLAIRLKLAQMKEVASLFHLTSLKHYTHT